MTQQIINVGTAADDHSGDLQRVAFMKSNDNFTELYNKPGGATISDTPPASPQAGSFWWESDSGVLWLYFSPQWVSVGGTKQGADAFATVNYVQGNYLPLVGGTVSGVVTFQQAAAFQQIPTSITPAGTSDDGSVATTAFVKAYNVPYSRLPTEIQQIPIGFPFAGKPAVNASLFIPMAMALTVPANLTGSVGYANTAPTGAPVFTLNKISSGGVTTALGTFTGAASSKTFTVAGAGGSLAAGDTLQIIAPSTADATMADVGLTVLAMRT